MTFFWAADLAEADGARLAAPTAAVAAMEPFRKERRGDFGLRMVDLEGKRICASRGLNSTSPIAPGRVRSYHNPIRSQKSDVMGQGHVKVREVSPGPGKWRREQPGRRRKNKSTSLFALIIGQSVGLDARFGGQRAGLMFG